MGKTKLLLIMIIIMAMSCSEKPSLEGLWVVESVKVGEDEMTPNAKWMRFNADFTQESGNGWFQHSVGAWEFNPETNALRMKTSNGLHDPNEPFQIVLKENEMRWSRTEEDAQVTVLLKRAKELPKTFGDDLLGLWKLDRAEGKGKYFRASEGITSNEYLFFRWDKRFVIGSENGRINGVYNVHGHKPEVELIPYGEQFERDFWKIDFQGNSITLKLLNTDSTVTRTFTRIHEFPQ